MSKRNEDSKQIDRLFSLLNSNPDGAVQSADAAQYDKTATVLGKFIAEIPGGFFIYRADNNKVLYVNDALLEIYRCRTREEFAVLTGDSFAGMVHPDDFDAVQKSIFEQIGKDNNDLDYVEYRIIRKDGAVRWVEDYGHFVRGDADGDIFYVFISDATEKINRRFALMDAEQEKEQQLQTLIEEYDKERKLIRQEHLQRLEVIEGLSVNYESICYVDLDANRILPYRLSSRLETQFAKKLQMKPFDWFLRSYTETWVHPDDRAMFTERTSIEYIREKLADSQTYYLNYRCIRNNETQYIQLRIVNVGEKTRVQKLVMGFRKVDEEIMQAMKHKQVLETALNTAKIADKAKNTFLSNMSHDMRTPLNAIFGYTELARKNATDTAALHSYLDKIEQSGRQMLSLVEKVLDFSYVKSSTDAPVELSACSICAILGEVEETIRPRAEAKNIDFRIGTRIIHDTVLSDAERLKQLLVHLADNAVKYTRNDGCVRITAEESDCQDEYSSFTFAVTDNGVGISEDGLKRIFEPFERDTNTTLSGEYGVGLGLTIAKHLTDSLGGKIEAASELGKGSVFTVKLAFLRPSDDAPAQAPEPVSAIGKRILLVDDNDINLDMETEILQDLGFEVDVAENGKIAVEKVKNSERGRYDLILMDIQMPVMDGREATRVIRALADPALSRIPIVALSANAFDSDKRESIACGMDAHLPKPIDERLLLDTISKVVSE